MRKGSPSDTAKQGRLVAVVIAATALVWLGAQFIGGQAGLSSRVLALFDLLALAGFAWALIVTFGIWRARQGNGE